MIELMIVLAIIGILTAIAIPSFNDYITRTQVAEALELVAGSKTGLAEFFSGKGHWPSTASSVMTTTAGKYVSNIAITGGTAGTTGPIQLTATMKNVGVNTAIQGGTVLFTSTDGSQWSCNSGGDKPIAYKYLRSCES